MTATLPPEVVSRLDRAADPAGAMLDEVDGLVEQVEAALEHLTAKRTKQARELDPVTWAGSAVEDLSDVLGRLRAHLEADR